MSGYKMIRRVLIFLIMVTHAVSDYCVRYTFEENFDDWLINEWGGACASMPFWLVGKYSDLYLTGQNKSSTSFIMPLPELSCVSSFIFSMNIGGTIEVNIYMEATDPSDQVIVLANLIDITGGDRVTGMEAHSASDPSFVRGWRSLTMTLTGSDTYDGYISIMGMAAPESIVLVDSFRYIPPGLDESECQLYEEMTTPDPTTVSTPDPITTHDPTTVATPDPITTPDPTTVATPDPITTPIPDPITTPSPDPITTLTPDPITTPTPDSITTHTLDPITTPTPDPTTTPETTTITTVTVSGTTTPTTTSMDSESDDTGAPTPYPCPTPPMENEDSKGFWTPLTITMLVLLYLIVLALVCLLFYEIGRRRAKAAAAADNFDFESLPSSFKVPRIKTVYPDANTNPYARRKSW